MANGDGAAIDVYLADVEFEIADRCDRLGRKSFVDLDHVNIVGIKAGARQRLARSKDGPRPMVSGLQPDTAILLMRTIGSRPAGLRNSPNRPGSLLHRQSGETMYRL
ncbi:MAG: hypothetical protein Ct9H300mP16_08230 [Pseudomonadota bacterium]|nr:MAG: hypothetical protein Ct9H300mP16_08230 [Pseudomonadota bacterium]